MSATLSDIIKDRIRTEGPMDLGTYMDLCLAHPEHGYYMTRDPFGVAGDFTTAPEVSQLFGEMIGAWLADLWIKFEKPSAFTLLECGPGRGTLMADIMRATRHVSGFHDAAKIVLMEISPVLRGFQQERLHIYDPHWISDVNQLKSAGPVFIVANEFLDALPIRHMVFSNGMWAEKAIALDENDTLCWVDIPAEKSLLEFVPPALKNTNGNGVSEISPVLNYYINSVNILLKKHNGAALIIDYGHMRSAMGDTLQCMKEHKFVDIFDTPGTCDITAHVDFENVARIAKADGITVHGPVTQGAFLQSLGIDRRAERLWAGANEVQRQSIITGHERLIDTASMGALFKVMALCSDPKIIPEGFDENL